MTSVSRTVHRAAGSAWFWVVFVLAGFGVWLSGLFTYRTPEAPPVLEHAPAFEARDHRGETVNDRVLRGSIWVAAAIPRGDSGRARHVAVMGRLQRRMRRVKRGLMLISVSQDDREALDDQASRWAAHHTRWRLLEPAPELLRALPEGELLLIDYDGRIRGRYGEDDRGVSALLRDVGLVLGLEPQARNNQT